MRIGLFLLTSAPLPALLSQMGHAERAGFATIWLPNIFAHDALTVLALAGHHTTSIELGVGVVPTYPRHPAALAQQALTVQAATGNRLLLGIGPSHQVVIEQMMGLSYAKPIAHMRDYLGALTALLSGQPTDFTSDCYQINLQLNVPDAAPPPVLIAALRPQMLRLAGQLADGTMTWLGGLRYLQDVAIPVITQAAHDARRSAPRVVVGLPVAVTDKPDAARAVASRIFAVYATLPAYRAVLDIEGAKDAADVALIGTQAEIAQRLDQFAAIGVTDLAAVIYDMPEDPGARERTYDFLAEVAALRT
jgi:5,10-methylenetetrahydromethanopterin reductase